ncbi:MAG TPA: sigma-70 family RNA polymerase sigma factor [Rummeliibacillus sp.]|nr:sigma-70 family RNA polymerase sigma factor [Rummeliibacillus sp.]
MDTYVETKDFSNSYEWLNYLMDEYGEKLTNLAYGYCKDWGKAEEIVQDVFITCFHQYKSSHKIKSYKAWIYRITINRAKDSLRTAWFKRVSVQNELFAHLTSNTSTPERNLESNETSEQLANAIMQLPLKYREMIILFYYEELSIQEISEIINMNENTVKTRLNRGREKLKPLLERGDYYERL